MAEQTNFDKRITVEKNTVELMKDSPETIRFLQDKANKVLTAMEKKGVGFNGLVRIEIVQGYKLNFYCIDFRVLYQDGFDYEIRYNVGERGNFTKCFFVKFHEKDEPIDIDYKDLPCELQKVYDFIGCKKAVKKLLPKTVLPKASSNPKPAPKEEIKW